MTLSWAPPDSDGGASIQGYVVERKEPYSSKWTPVGKTDDTTFTVRGLKAGSQYEFRVAAENKAGVGAFSPSSPPTVAKEPYGKERTGRSSAPPGQSGHRPLPVCPSY